MAEFIIVFREVLEASLVVGIIYLLIEKTKQNEHFSQLWYGVFASILASIAVGYLVIQAKNSLGNNSTQALFEAVFLYLTAFLIWYVIFWLSKNVSDKKDFISYDAKRPIAKRVIQLCKEVGVLLTPAGSTYPHFHDPLDSNIRLAPTFLGVEDLQDAMEVFVTAIMLAHQELD